MIALAVTEIDDSETINEVVKYCGKVVVYFVSLREP